MAAPGYKGWFGLDTAAGSLTNIQPYLSSVTVPQPIDTTETSTLGTVSKSSINTLQDGGVINLAGPYSAAMHTHFTGLKAAQAAGTASHSWMWGPGGSVSGEAKVNAECILASYDLSNDVGGRSEWTATLQITGAVTNGTF